MHSLQNNENDANSMESGRDRFIEYLSSHRGLPTEQLARVQKLVAETGDSLPRTFVKLGLLSEDQLLDTLATCFELERFDSTVTRPPIDLGALPPAFLREHQLGLVSRDDEVLTVVLADPLDDFAIRALAFSTAKRVVPKLATLSEVDTLVASQTGQDLPTNPATSPATATPDEDDIDGLRDLASEAPTVRLVQRLISDAVERKSSDIHIEPAENALVVRYRIDGVLQEVERLPMGTKGAVVSRLKILAHLNIAERRLPQDGRIRLAVQGKETDFRMSTSPTVHGESVVLRILDRQEVALDFTALGLDHGSIATIRAALAKPYGIVLSTGPTGSGKTTTLYTALRELNSAERKILTVEDPVEYALEGVQQAQVKPSIGYSFASALRAFLRQDPDVMMVGEIRDRETAEIAIQAALTGHLLLSTLHTNSAAAAITRLLDMGVDDYLLTSTINLLIGQRLVRRLCAQCREVRSTSLEFFQRWQLAVPPAGVELYQAKGCRACHGTGYTGRTSIVELLELREPIQKLVLARADATTIERAAIAQGMRTMFQHGIEKALAGDTTLEEVLRVTRMVSP
jgi:general secretion pathway protein E